MSLNYLGQSHHTAGDPTLLGPAQERTGLFFLPDASRAYLIDIVARIAGGRFYMTWTYSRDLYRQETVEALARQCLDRLRALPGLR